MLPAWLRLPHRSPGDVAGTASSSHRSHQIRPASNNAGPSMLPAPAPCPCRPGAVPPPSRCRAPAVPAPCPRRPKCPEFRARRETQPSGCSCAGVLARMRNVRGLVSMITEGLGRGRGLRASLRPPRPARPARPANIKPRFDGVHAPPNRDLMGSARRAETWRRTLRSPHAHLASAQGRRRGRSRAGRVVPRGRRSVPGGAGS